jgi:hypothetical protein
METDIYNKYESDELDELDELDESDKYTTDKSTTDKYTTDKSTTDKSNTDKSNTDKSTIGKTEIKYNDDKEDYTDGVEDILLEQEKLIPNKELEIKIEDNDLDNSNNKKHICDKCDNVESLTGE